MWLASIFLVALIAQRATAQYSPDYVENVYGSDRLGSRIVSGWEAEPGQIPYQVSLRMVNLIGTVTGCGGNIVHREWLLTAAHCTASQITIIVRAGLVHLTRPEMFLETTEYYVYPTFDVTNPLQVQLNDISLVKLQRPLVYSNTLRPIRIQPSSDAFRNYEGEIVTASGFGRTWTNGAQSQALLWVHLRGVSNAACASLFSTRFVSDNTICARFYNVTSQSICQGDSGGPLVHLSDAGEPILIGISSFVAGLPHGCHSGLPGAFARPGPFHEWLTQISGIDFNDLTEEITTVTPTTPEPVPTTISSTYPPSSSPSPSTSPSPSPTTPPSPSPTTLPSPSPTTSPSPSPTTLPSPSPTTPPSPSPTIPPSPSPTTLSSPGPTIPPPTTGSPVITTTVLPTTTTTEEPVTEEDSEDIDDPELADLLKRLEVKVKVNVRLSKYSKKKNDLETIEY